MISRRDFLKTLSRLAVTAGGTWMILSDPSWQRLLQGGHAGLAFGDTYLDELIKSAPKARYWKSLEIRKGGTPKDQTLIQCLLCANNCVIADGQCGRCRTRMNVKGELRSLVYGRPISVHIDPIEKKPFYHFLPGSAAFSLATAGCPLKCKFCQNWEISQSSPEDFKAAFTPPAKLTSAARASRAPVIAFTYNEPTVFTEYLTDIARNARQQGVRCVMISCGFMNQEPLAEMCETLAAIKIDLKGYSEDFYRLACRAELKPVLRSIRQIARSRAHLEIVNLVVPTLNDSDKMLKELIDWVMGEVGPDVPLHFSRFHPDYQLRNLPPTPVATLERAYRIARDRGLHYPYVGNVPDHPGNNTYCPKCGKIAVKRQGFFMTEMNIRNGLCQFCRNKIAGVWT